MTNGWRDGRDPAQRVLRVITVIVCLVVFAYLAIDPDRNLDTTPALALAIGAVMVLLGYEGVIRLPFIGRRTTMSIDFYPWAALLASVVLTILFVVHLVHVLRTEPHSPMVLGTVVLVVAGIGLTISASGRFVDSMSVSLIGLSIVRGALLVGSIVLVVTDWKGE